MQGRLSPPVGDQIQCFPVETWETEFFLAQEVGLTSIEWVFQKSTSFENPISCDEGINKVIETSNNSGVKVSSITADYYMEENLISKDGQINQPAFQHLKWLIGQAKKINVKYVMAPFVDGSSLNSLKEQAGLSTLLQTIVPSLEESGVELHMETDLHPEIWSGILSQVAHPLIRACYDTGDRASLGFDSTEEFIFLLEFIGSVHIKDRLLGGATVPLGTGNARLPETISALERGGYRGNYILQPARAMDGDHVGELSRYYEMVKGWIEKD